MTTDVVDGDELIETAYPTAGPHSLDLMASAGVALHKLVRFLNYATLPENRGAALPYASDAYRICGSLRQAATLQQQLYNQLAQRCDEFARDPVLGHAEHRREEINHSAAMEATEEAARAFRSAAGHSSELTAWLDAAHAALAPLYHDIEEGDGD